MGYCATNLNFQDVILIYIINIKLRTKLYIIACDTNLIKNFILIVIKSYQFLKCKIYQIHKEKWIDSSLWGSNGTSIYKTETDVHWQDLLAIHQHSTDQAIKACI